MYYTVIKHIQNYYLNNFRAKRGNLPYLCPLPSALLPFSLRSVIQIHKIHSDLITELTCFYAQIVRYLHIESVDLVGEVAVVADLLEEGHDCFPVCVAADKGEIVIVLTSVAFLNVGCSETVSELAQRLYLIAVYELGVAEVPASTAGNRIAHRVDDCDLFLKCGGEAVLGLSGIELRHIFNGDSRADLFCKLEQGSVVVDIRAHIFVEGHFIPLGRGLRVGNHPADAELARCNDTAAARLGKPYAVFVRKLLLGAVKVGF